MCRAWGTRKGNLCSSSQELRVRWEEEGEYSCLLHPSPGSKIKVLSGFEIPMGQHRKPHGAVLHQYTTALFPDICRENSFWGALLHPHQDLEVPDPPQQRAARPPKPQCHPQPLLISPPSATVSAPSPHSVHPGHSHISAEQLRIIKLCS